MPFSKEEKQELLKIRFLGGGRENVIKFITLLTLILLSLLPLFGVIDASSLIKLREFFLSICYLALIMLLWNNKYSRVLSIFLILLWITNVLISILIYQLFNSHFNNELAMIVLSTNFSEAKDFIFNYWYILIIGLILFTIVSSIAIKLSFCLSTKRLMILPIILLLTVIYKFSESVFKGKLNDPRFNMAEKVLPYTSLNNFGVFSRAYQELNILKTVFNADIPTYQLTIDDTHINTYVIVIGESVRRDHVSLYGYSRQTTPYIEEQKNNLFIFNQAIASAPITTMSLASALTIKSPVDSTTFELLSDNIINLANQAQFDTYWFSRQAKIGQFDTVVTSIANFSKYKEWLIEGYDDVLLSKLDEALKEDSNNRKKLIILHTNGSHLSACNKYPKEEAYFVNAQSEYIDCYDNSILFTDKLMKQIFNRLEHQSASVLYFSDHGQKKRIKPGKIDYIHGAINPTKESVDVPLFLWFSPFIKNTDKKIGSYLPLYSMTNNYFLIANWLGISEINGQKVSSPLLDSYVPQDKIIVVDTQLNVFDYRTLQSDNVEHLIKEY